MIITFKNDRLRKLLNSRELLEKKFQKKTAELIQSRMVFLAAVKNVNEIPVTRPFLRHKLTGNRKNEFAISVDEQYRITFLPHQNENDLRKIEGVEIQSVEDYHP